MRGLRAIAALAGLALLGLAGPALAHVITFSHVQLRLRPDATEVRVQLPLAALAQQTPPVPPSAAGEVVSRRLVLKDGARAVPLTIRAVRPAGDDIAVEASAPRIAGALRVSADLFPEDPLHKVFVEVYRGADLAGQYPLDHRDPAFTLEAETEPLGRTVAAFVREGVRHIFIGPDHILFVLALVLLGGRLWAQVKIITAFTLAHSLTLTLATLGLVTLPSRLVESVIALSIVAVGTHDLWRLRRAAEPGGRDPRAAFAFGFGLVHGFGFASVLGELDIPRQALGWSLAAFNLGVEIGQVVIVLAAAPLLWGLTRYAPPPVARGALTAGAIGVVAMGGFWFVQRAFGLG